MKKVAFLVILFHAILHGTVLFLQNFEKNAKSQIPSVKRTLIKISGNSSFITGPQNLNGAEVMATDLRASVSLVLAGLCAQGLTTINRVYHLDRGYENIEETLGNCGPKIIRLK